MVDNIVVSSQIHSSSWHSAALAQAREHPFVTAGLGVSLLVVLALLIQSTLLVFEGRAELALRYTLMGGMAGFAATALGALPAFFLQRLPQRLEDSLLGFAAGMMFAASAFSLILPGLAAANDILGQRGLAAGIVIIGIGLGVLLMLGLDAFTPHEHDKTGPCGPAHQRYRRLWLFVFAIALHNLPEGMAIGVSFARSDLSVGVPLTTSIALQDIPEGLAVVMALRAAGFSELRAAAIAVVSGLPEPFGALLGLGLASGWLLAYPIGLGLAAGAMIFVVSHEVIPETHRHGHQTSATIGLVAGFALMMLLDTMFG